MRARPYLLAVTVAAGLAAPGGAPSALGAETPPRGYRLRKLDDGKTRSSVPFTVPTGAPACNPLVPAIPQILGPDFDPATVDEITVSGDARAVAWATTISEAGLPGTTRDVAIFREGVEERVRASDANGDNDQPSLDGDRFGLRMVFRGSDGARGTSAGNIYLRSVTKKPAPAPAPTKSARAKPIEEVATVRITELVSTAGNANFGTAYDPTLCSRIRIREVDSGVKVTERDARIAFVSTGDLFRGSNEDHRPQLFLWREQADEFVQLTSIAPEGFAVNRPSISAGADRIAFECNADLTPDATDPKDPTRVGNPSKVRQIYLWDQRTGIRQLTWSDRDCYSPRIARNGRFVLFSSRGDLITGGNPEANSEIFAWVDGGDPARRLRQKTRTVQGENVLARPTTSPEVFTFWSTSAPAEDGAEFGAGAAQCGTLAYLFRRGRIVRVGGNTDLENLQRGAESPDPTKPENPVFAGPPCPGTSERKIHFATNDPRLNADLADDDLDGQNGGKDDQGNPKPDDRRIDASLFLLHVARVYR